MNLKEQILEKYNKGEEVILKDTDGDYQKVLGICGEIVFLSEFWNNNFSKKEDFDYKFGNCITFKEVERFHFLYTPPEEEWSPEKLESGVRYWYIACNGKILNDYFDNFIDCKEDIYRLKTNNIFRTEEEAIKRLKEIMEN